MKKLLLIFLLPLPAIASPVHNCLFVNTSSVYLAPANPVRIKLRIKNYSAVPLTISDGTTTFIAPPQQSSYTASKAAIYATAPQPARVCTEDRK